MSTKFSFFFVRVLVYYACVCVLLVLCFYCERMNNFITKKKRIFCATFCAKNIFFICVILYISNLKLGHQCRNGYGTLWYTGTTVPIGKNKGQQWCSVCACHMCVYVGVCVCDVSFVKNRNFSFVFVVVSFRKESWSTKIRLVEI